VPKPTRNTPEIAKKLMIVASGEMNLQSKHNQKAASEHSRADAIPSFSIFSLFVIPFESNVSIPPK